MAGTHLSLVLKGEWYDKIRAGTKTVEYREDKPYWRARITNAIETVSFRRGYGSDYPLLQADVISIIKQPGLHCDLKHNGKVFAIIFNNVREAE